MSSTFSHGKRRLSIAGESRSTRAPRALNRGENVQSSSNALISFRLISRLHLVISLHLLGALFRREEEVTVGLKVEVGHFVVVDVQRPLGLAQKVRAEQGHLNVLFQRELLPNARHRQRRRTLPVL